MKLSIGAASESFRYDPAGNLIEWVDRLGRTVQIERDLLGRVTEELAYVLASLGDRSAVDQKGLEY